MPGGAPPIAISSGSDSDNENLDEHNDSASSSSSGDSSTSSDEADSDDAAPAVPALPAPVAATARPGQPHALAAGTVNALLMDMDVNLDLDFDLAADLERRGPDALAPSSSTSHRAHDSPHSGPSPILLFGSDEQLGGIASVYVDRAPAAHGNASSSSAAPARMQQNQQQHGNTISVLEGPSTDEDFRTQRRPEVAAASAATVTGHRGTKRRRDETGAADASAFTNDATASKDLVADDDDDADMSSLCSICTENFCTSGPHQTVSLPCGHLFGKSCIKEWFRRCGEKNSTCPTCRKSSKKSGMRRVVATRVIAMDTRDRDEAVTKSKRLERENAALIKTINAITVERDRFKHDNYVLRSELRRYTTAGAQAGLIGNQDPGTCAQSNPLEINRHLQFTKLWELTLSQEPDMILRVMAYDPVGNIIAVSKGGRDNHGLVLINTFDPSMCKPLAGLHKSTIRDVKFVPASFSGGSGGGRLVLTVSQDKTVRLTSIESMSVVWSASLEKPIWSCGFHPLRPHEIYVGLVNNTLSMLNLRNPSYGPTGGKVVYTITSREHMGAPGKGVHAVHPLRNHDDVENENERYMFVCGNLERPFSFDGTDSFGRQYEGEGTVCSGVSVLDSPRDGKSGENAHPPLVLASWRNSERSTSIHRVYNARNGSLITRVVGRSMQRSMLRNVLFRGQVFREVEDSAGFAGHAEPKATVFLACSDEATQTVDVWDLGTLGTGTGQSDADAATTSNTNNDTNSPPQPRLAHSIPVGGVVWDMCVVWGVPAPGMPAVRCLACVTERSVSLWRI